MFFGPFSLCFFCVFGPGFCGENQFFVSLDLSFAFSALFSFVLQLNLVVGESCPFSLTDFGLLVRKFQF